MKLWRPNSRNIKQSKKNNCFKLTRANRISFFCNFQKDLKNKELNSNPTDITIQLMQQLPTIFVSGAKKCGTKTLMRFFGHHPQIIRGTNTEKCNTCANSSFYRVTRSALQNHRRHEERYGVLSDSFVDTLDGKRAVYQ